MLGLCLFKMRETSLLDAMHEFISNSLFMLKINKEDLVRLQ